LKGIYMLTVDSATNPCYANIDGTCISLEVKFAEFDEVMPFGATPHDPMPYGVELFNRAIAGEFGPIAPFPVESIIAQVRITRDGLLKSSDWTQLPDVPQATKDMWATYRQALRDITEQAGFPSNVTWPTAPQ
jgi:hypothetical protein